MNLTKYFSIFKTIAAFLLFFTLPAQVMAQLTVSANRSQYAPGDNIILKVETSNPADKALDLSPLQTAFILLDQKKMMINSYSEGKRTSTARWELQLRARKSGYLEVPSLVHNNETSEPFSLFIKSSSRARFLPVSNLPVILDAQLSTDDSYEKALFLYTLNLYSDRPLAANYSLSPPKINKANVVFLDSTEVQKIDIRGKEYDVQERRYAIFPTEMGRFVIEGPVFNGAQQGSNQILARANNLEINVRARQDFDNTNDWLPATQVTLTNTWHKTPKLMVGDIIEREITLQIQGMAAADIPDIKIAIPEIVKLLSSDSSLSDKIDKNGILGSKVIKQKMQLLERGELTFDALTVHWWDTNDDRSKIKKIDQLILNVMSGPNGESSIEREVAQNLGVDKHNADITIIKTDSSLLLWALVALTVLSSGGWLFNLRKIKRIKDSQAEAFHDNLAKAHQSPPAETDKSRSKQILKAASGKSFNAKAELNTFQTLGRSCAKDDLISTHRRLLEWANQYWYEQKLQSIDEISVIAENDTLSQVLSQMQHLLDTHDVSSWQGDALFEALTQIRQD
ncbi:MAG: BatD family protein [Oceanospirillaceae bacterium]|nr:BatD family protein [Oceanospirillaceae bacterium]